MDSEYFVKYAECLNCGGMIHNHPVQGVPPEEGQDQWVHSVAVWGGDDRHAARPRLKTIWVTPIKVVA